MYNVLSNSSTTIIIPVFILMGWTFEALERTKYCSKNRASLLSYLTTELIAILVVFLLMQMPIF